VQSIALGDELRLMTPVFKWDTIRKHGDLVSLDQFLAKRGGSAILARGRALKQSNAALFASIQQRFGVPPGPLLAIRVSGGRAGTRTLCRLWLLSPMTAVGRPISPSSSTQL
jgi:hypothetical protein